MEASIEKKDSAIERLVDLTQSLLLEVDSGDIETVEKVLRDRSKLILQIQKIDQELKDRVTKNDQKWMGQLSKLKDLDQELKIRLETQLSHLVSQLRRSQMDKSEIIKRNFVDPKGQNLTRKA